MPKAPNNQTHYTNQVQLLVGKIYGRSILNDSLLERAIHYFDNNEFVESHSTTSTESDTLHKLEKIERHNHLQSICCEIIELAEGDTLQESNRKTARLLGTIQLISPTEGSKVAVCNEQNKVLYKAILSLRLLDRLLLDNELNDPYIVKVLTEFNGKSFVELDEAERERFTELVRIPLLMAALLQNIGHHHPEARVIFSGEDGKKDRFRILDITDRKKLLKINYKETLSYISNAIGVLKYTGNSKELRDQFVIEEQLKHQFIKKLIKSSFKPEQGIGNLLKVPQIYVSIVLSTKEAYNYKVLPQVFQVLNKNAELGSCSQKAVDALYKITGMFPQGYGIVYMPEDEMGHLGDCYEYAIVNRLYPETPENPLCRIAT